MLLTLREQEESAPMVGWYAPIKPTKKLLPKMLFVRRAAILGLF